MPIYRPRFGMKMTVPLLGDARGRKAAEELDTTWTIEVPCKKVEIISTDHNHCDEAHVTAAFRDIGTDVRLLTNATATVHIINADPSGRWEMTPANAAFAGVLTRPQRSGDSESGLDVELEFLDYTRLFLKAKPFGQKGIPDFSQTLSEAWKRIVSQTPGAEALSDTLVLQGITGDPKLSDAVAKRFAKFSKVPTKPRCDAWAVWKTTVGMLGLVTYIHLDKCIVTTATNYWTRSDPPRFIWGQNIKHIEESRDEVYRKGICMTSYDPITMRTVEGFYPPVGDKSIRKKNVSPKRLGDQNAVLLAEEREYFQSPLPTTDKKVLEKVAQAVYEERSRQELQGTLETKEMVLQTMRSHDFDIVRLKAGDSIRVEFKAEDLEMLQAYAGSGGTVEAMAGYLKGIGYSPTMAELLARNAKSLSSLDPTFLVKRSEVRIETDEEGGTFSARVTYCNRLLVSGDAAQ